MQRKDDRQDRPVKCETKHNGHRRAFAHDYREKGTYMVTMVVEGRQRLLGHIEGSVRGRKGTTEAPHVVLSELGKRIVEEEIGKINHFYPMVEVWCVAMMPDHIHLLIRVKEPLPEGKHLGTIVRGFKTGCTRAWWSLNPSRKALGTSAVVPVASPTGNEKTDEQNKRPVLFEKGYHDRIINRPGMLENIKQYMAENPLRARIRQECPKLMERKLSLWIAGHEYAAFGNIFLLKYPIKQQVFFHRRDAATGQPTETTEAYQKEKERLLKLAEEGTVLVTPGISKGESLVVSETIERGLPLILLQKEPIGEYWKPSQRRFYACATGQLLIIAPKDMDREAKTRWKNSGNNNDEEVSDYARFHSLNDMAKEICEGMEVRIINYEQMKELC